MLRLKTTGIVALLIVAGEVSAAEMCAVGYGYYNDNLRASQQDSYFKINARLDAFGNVSGAIQYLGYINHSGSRNQLVGNAMSFCSYDIDKLKVMGPYAGYGVAEGAYNHATICESKDGTPNFDTMSIDGCSSVKHSMSASLFSSGSNIKDTGTAPKGNRGFDDFNIAVVYGNNEFATSNGFVRDGSGFVYVGRCDAVPVEAQNVVIDCQ